MSSSSRKVMFHPNATGKRKELAARAAASAREPARLRRVQNQASGDAAHDIFRGDVTIVLLIPNGLLKAVVGDAGLDIVADELSPGQGPLLVQGHAGRPWQQQQPAVDFATW